VRLYLTSALQRVPAEVDRRHPAFADLALQRVGAESLRTPELPVQPTEQERRHQGRDERQRSDAADHTQADRQIAQRRERLVGRDFGNGLTEREVDYMVREEWARTADDVLWRRSKCGLGLAAAARERVAAYVAQAATVAA
jgi:glycerol-3-phosphate dehydrogenase